MRTVIDNIENLYPWMIALSFSCTVFSQIVKNNVENTVNLLLASFQNIEKDEIKIPQSEYEQLIREIGFRELSSVVRTMLFLSFLSQFGILVFTKISDYAHIFGANSPFFEFAFFTNMIMLLLVSIIGAFLTYRNPRQTLYSKKWG